MKYTVILSRKASKFIETLSKKDYELVINKVLTLEKEPYQSGIKVMTAPTEFVQEITEFYIQLMVENLS